MKTNSFSAWVLAVRPYSLGNAVILVGVASMLAWSEGVFHLVPALLCLIFAVAMQCTANLVNDMWDYLKGSDQPDRLGSDRAFAKGYITPTAMKIGIGCFTAVSALVGLSILAWALHHTTLPYGGWELVAVGAACIFFAWIYTAGPYPLAYHGLGDVAVLIFFGIVPVCCTYFIQTSSCNTDCLVVSVSCGLVIDTMLMINNFRDREEDARCDKRTIVVYWGAAAGRWGYLLLGVVPVALCLWLAVGGRIWGAVLPLIYLVMHISTWRHIVRIDHGEELNVCMGETARNIWIFGLTLMAGLALDRLFM